MLHDNLRRHYHHEVHDLHKPNCVFSSDIAEKVATAVDSYVALRSTANESTDVDLGSMLEFHINIELNTLLVRNNSLKPTELMKNNHICLAKSTNRNKLRNTATAIDTLLAISHTKPVDPRALRSDEVFIVDLTLHVLHFIASFDLDELPQSLVLDIVDDETHQLLNVCDSQLMVQIETYIKHKFILEVGNRLGQPVFVPSETSSDTIIEGLGYVSGDYSVSETTLEGTDNENDGELPDKSILYTNGEYTSSLEDLIILPSNDTVRSEEDDEMTPGSSTMFASRPNRLRTIREEKKEESFIENINNLRHNEEYINLDELQEVECDYDNHIAGNSEQLGPGIELELPRSIDSEFTSPASPAGTDRSLSRQSSIASNYSPTKKVSRMTSSPSFSLVNYEENHGLEYAFKAKSQSVPNYIREDKKFKFIKVGKVQKFVHLFEEKTGSNTPKVTPKSSKASTRASSPERQSATC
ncbi:transactivator protein [Scheffersomyces stipitis CBS 6054]|uniref:Transactivator protein n=1 Tax=Scheffersomyces stipitis (strain ATCC 58785 / CBS 6054 / NBRC 10063 / NRRL Y-11545) TaxID=322104 RepID=A3GFJ2_PICST|nr:transactivator protein [Scheffersomyces stipitis CBS 6054]EAZ63765.2 transactivator protein [Scheffersomyces stipitis CBS 6054]